MDNALWFPPLFPLSNRPIGRLENAVSPFAFIETRNSNRDRMAAHSRAVFLLTSNLCPLTSALPNRKSPELEMGLTPALSTKPPLLIASQTGGAERRVLLLFSPPSRIADAENERCHQSEDETSERYSGRGEASGDQD